MFYIKYDGTGKISKDEIHGVTMKCERLCDKALFVYEVCIISSGILNTQIEFSQWFSNERLAILEYEKIMAIVNHNIDKNGVKHE